MNRFQICCTNVTLELTDQVTSCRDFRQAALGTGF
jgi:hypothetical protein